MGKTKILTDLYDADALSVEIERHMRETGGEVIVTWGKFKKEHNKKHVPIYSPGQIRGMSLQEMIDCANRVINENEVEIERRQESTALWSSMIKRAEERHRN